MTTENQNDGQKEKQLEDQDQHQGEHQDQHQGEHQGQHQESASEHTVPISRDDIKERMRTSDVAPDPYAAQLKRIQLQEKRKQEQQRQQELAREQALAKSEAKAASGQAADQPVERRKRLPLWARIILKTLRLLIVPILCLTALFVGLYIGYTVIGEQDSQDIWNIETWKHAYELVFG